MADSENTTRSPAPEFLADLIDHTSNVLTQNGVDKSQAQTIAKDVSKRMCDVWGGQLIYFPYWLRMDIDQRDRDIYNDYTGDNVSQLSRKYGLSVQSIYRSINKVKAEEFSKRQSKLDL